MKKILLIPVVILLAVACHKEPVLDSDGEYLVYTAPGKETTFTSFTTFDLADSLLIIGQSTKPEYSQHVRPCIVARTRIEPCRDGLHR